jgi:uncharacterized membrane-anchored protein
MTGHHITLLLCKVHNSQDFYLAGRGKHKRGILRRTRRRSRSSALLPDPECGSRYRFAFRSDCVGDTLSSRVSILLS